MDSNLLTFAHLSPDNTMDLRRIMLEAIIRVLGSQTPLAMLPVGAKVHHEMRGEGRIAEIMQDGRRVVDFGEQGKHRCERKGS